MKITKRNGDKMEFNPNKILNRVKRASKGLSVDYTEIAIEVQSLIYDGISTKEVDLNLSNIAAAKIAKHPDYSFLASNLIISRLHKELNVNDVSSWLLRLKDYLAEDVVKKAEKWLDSIDYSYDYSYDFIGISTFFTSLAISKEKVVLETPIEMVLRNNLMLAETKEDFLRSMAADINYASPILTNCGTKNNTLISCSLNEVPSDSKEGILESLNETASQSKSGAGIGKWIGKLRSKDSYYNNGRGKASGILKYCKLENEFTRYFKQHEKRRGKAAVYLNIWHKDILDFIEMKNPHGSEETTTRDLMTAILVNNLFYKRFYNKEKWSTFCPNEVLNKMGFNLYDFYGEEFEEKYVSCENNSDLSRNDISAEELMTSIVSMQSKSGVPYIFNIDRSNEANAQSSFGIQKTSQLCVPADTLILTDKGHQKIIDTIGLKTNVWNGECFSEVIPYQTNADSKLVKVTTSWGQELISSLEHHYWVEEKTKTGKRTKPTKYKRIEARELKIGDKLIKFELPILEGNLHLNYAYTQGFYSGDGCENNPHISLYGIKRDLVPFLDIRNKMKTNREYSDEIGIREEDNRIIVKLPTDIKDKLFVPSTDYNIESRLLWFAGLLDSDGTLTINKESQGVQIASVNLDFLKNVQYMLQTLGCKSRITLIREEGMYELPSNDGSGENKLFKCNTTYRLLVSGRYLFNLLKLGLKCNRLNIKYRDVRQEGTHFNKVEKIEYLESTAPTYCFTEPLRNMGVFNGILTGNCIEVCNYVDAETSGQCCLGAMVLPSFIVNGTFDFDKLVQDTSTLSYNLNRVIDIHEWSTERARNGGVTQRSIAIGIAGLADTFLLLDLVFDSEEAMVLNSKIQEAIYYGSILGSIEYNKKHKDLVLDERLLNSDLNKNGKFHFEYFDNDSYNLTLDWETLRKKVLKYGVCNSNFVANMPTATSAGIKGVNECFDPYQEIAMVRQTISGNMIVMNKHLVKDLETLGLWNESFRSSILREESIQNIDFGFEGQEYLKAKYRTIWEIPQKNLIKMAADRQRFVDHSQSMNLYWKKGAATTKNLVNALYYGWSLGLKTGVYYTKVQLDNSQKKDLAERKIEKPKDSPFDCFGCSA